MDNNSVYITGAEEYYGIPSGLYSAIIDAIGNTQNGVNSSGGYGLAGITPAIANIYKANRTNVNQNIITGAKYLADIQKNTGDWNSAAKKYLSDVGVNSSNFNFDFGNSIDASVGTATQSTQSTANNSTSTSQQTVKNPLTDYLTALNPFPNSAKNSNSDISIWGFLTTSFPYSSILLIIVALIILWYSIQSEIK